MKCSSRVVGSVLHNFLGTYTSRYSDFRGYWLLGQIAVAEWERTVVDLLGPPAGGNGLAPIAANLARRRFADQARKARLSLEVFRSATMTASVVREGERGWQGEEQSLGALVRFLVCAVTRDGRDLQRDWSVFLAPHDPRRERRRARSHWGPASGTRCSAQVPCVHAVSMGKDLMGYELHVTRAREWFESEGSPISPEEWLAYVSTDPEMRHDASAEATTPEGETLRVEDPGIAVWTAWSGHGADGAMAWIRHEGARLVSKDPDREIRQKLFRIARALEARLVGDDGEEYGEDGDAIDVEPADGSTLPRGRRPWWKRLFGGRF